MRKCFTVRPKPFRTTKKADTSYEKDFFKWTSSQINLLEKRDFEKLDIENLIEEIASLGRSERDKLESFLVVLLMHMLKVKFQPAKHTKSWDLSIKNSRHKVKRTLKENPSLKPKLPQLMNEAYFTARLEAAMETGIDEKHFPKTMPWPLTSVLE